MAPITERIADQMSGGALTAARNQLTEIDRKYTDLRSETRKLTREIETLKEGGTLVEGSADHSWNDRLALDQRWQNLSGYAQHRVIQKSDVDLYHDLMAYSYQFAPLIRAAVDIKTQYTFGQSYTITSENGSTKETIKGIINDARNRHALFGAQAIAEADRELQKGGNIYLAMWMGEDPVQMRLWTSYEIGDVILDPQDGDTPLYYVRSFISNGERKTVAYPSIYNENPVAKIPGAGFGYAVDPSIVVFQMSEGRQPKQKWALSPYTAALPWNRAYEQFLFDFAAIVQMIRKYTTMFTTKGGEAQVSSLQTQFAHEQHGHHANEIGNGIVATEGNEFKVIDAGSNKIVGAADSRFFLLQFCAAVRIPENLLVGNPQTGNRASAQELTAHFLPTIEERQIMWTETFKEIFTFILDDPEFEVSFPPIRTQDAQSYVATLMASSRYMQPRDIIKAVYEALDIKIPKDVEIDAIIADIEARMAANPADMAALNNLTQATNAMNQAIREAMKRLGQPAAA